MDRGRGAALVVTHGLRAGRSRASARRYRYDMAIQTVDPDPVYHERGAKPGDNGEKAAKATERYRKGQTKPVQRESSSSGNSASQHGRQPRKLRMTGDETARRLDRGE